jgi:hypothetical protein
LLITAALGFILGQRSTDEEEDAEAELAVVEAIR